MSLPEPISRIVPFGRKTGSAAWPKLLFGRFEGEIVLAFD